MIEKLDVMKDTRNVIDKDGIVHTVANFTAIDKINELVDAVNKLQEAFESIHPCLKYKDLIKRQDDPAENTTDSKMEQDPYAEQRKWIGKLCRFWDDDAFVTSNDWAFGILTSIDKGMQFQYCCNENCNFKHCEPVKPDDDIVYKEGADEKDI